MQFPGFVGNDEVKKQLSADMDGGRFPHALLLEGPAGSGRRTLARLLARAAVCSGSDPRPCGDCPACRKALAGGHPDILEAGGDGAARSFHIDTIRALREGAYVQPNEAPRRVLLLAGAHNMTEQAQNALLKILEEPPPHLLFILTCENRSEMLSTIQSRTVCLTLGGVSEVEALPLLKERLPAAGEEELRRALALFGGVIGPVLNSVANGGFRRVLDRIPAAALGVTAASEIDLLRLAAGLEKDKEAADGLLGGLKLVFRDALALRCGGSGETGGAKAALLSASPETADKLSRTLTRQQLMALIDTVEGLQQARLRNMNQTLFSTLFCARLRAAAGR